MQLYALNGQGRLCRARDAERHLNYVCRECGGPLRVRSGPHRQPHFFHLAAEVGCSQRSKGPEHLAVQFHLEQLLGPEVCELECRFDAIGRIADVVWWSQKIVFEVQCSPIRAAEALQRTADYRSLGFEVVWILHERTFNGFRLSAAEQELRRGLCYFTNFDAEGTGIVYDQLDCIEGGVRRHRLPPRAIDVSRPVSTMGLPMPILPLLAARRAGARLYFTGDYLALFADNPCHPDLQAAEQWRAADLGTAAKTDWKVACVSCLVRCYRILWGLILEKTCK